MFFEQNGFEGEIITDTFTGESQLEGFGWLNEIYKIVFDIAQETYRGMVVLGKQAACYKRK